MDSSSFLKSKKLVLIYVATFVAVIGIIFVAFLPRYTFAGNGGGGNGGGSGGGGGTYTPVWQGVRGYGQSEVVGPISMNCLNAAECATSNYKVEIDKGRKDLASPGTGRLKGQAYNPTVGWISFGDGSAAPADLANCPSGTCNASVNWATGNITGWAKVLSCNAGALPTFEEKVKTASSGSISSDRLSVALSAYNNRVIAGADQYTLPNAPGYAVVYQWNGSVLSEESRLQASDGVDNDYFGSAVAINDTTAVVGAPHQSTNGLAAGAIYIFTRSGSQWNQTQKIIPADVDAGDLFGSKIALDGNTIVVGAPGADYNNGVSTSNTGAVYVFTYNGSAWAQSQKLIANDHSSGVEFGNAVALSSGTLVIGAPMDPATAGNPTLASGSVYIFEESVGTWSQAQKIKASDPASNSLYGSAISISGNTIAVGSYQDATAGGWRAGSVYVLEKSGATWSETAHLFASDPEASDFFGYAVSVSGNTIAVGAYGKDIGGINGGKAYIFKKNAGWSETQAITGSTTNTPDEFGKSIALAGNNLLVVGAPNERNSSNVQTGAVFLFDTVAPPSCVSWISLSCQNDGSCGSSNYGVKVDKTTGLFSGYAWGGLGTSGGTGWIDFSGATANFVTTHGCYIPPQYGRTIFQYSATSTLSASNPTRPPSLFSPLKVGAYAVTLATFDDHSSPDGDTNESWYQSVFTSTGGFYTPASGDLPDYASYAEYKVSDFFAINNNSFTTANTLVAFASQPRNSRFTPACSVFDYVCPFEPQADRTIVTFTDPSNTIPLGMPVAPGISSPFSLSLPMGTYNVTFASYDNHTAQGSSALPSIGWYLKLFAAQGGSNFLTNAPSVGTLPVTDDFLISNTGTITVSQAVQTGIIVGDSNQQGALKGVTALCAAFDKVDAPVVTLSTLPVEPATINYGDTGAVLWDISGNYDQCYFDSQTPSGGEHTAWNILGQALPSSSGSFAAVYPPSGQSQGIYSYDLACSYGGAVSATTSISITLNPAVPLSVSLTPANQAVTPNAPATFSWSIVGDNSGGCVGTSSGAPAPYDTNWANYFAGSSDPRTGNFPISTVPSGAQYTFTLSCLDSAARSVVGSAIVRSPQQCSDGLDNDGDTYIDALDRGCWTNPANPATYNPTDDTEAGELICVRDNICQVKYGENPLNCKEDCKIQKYKDQ